MARFWGKRIAGNVQKDGSQLFYTRTFYGDEPEYVTGCMCEDGKTRTVTITGQPDTYFSTPARVKAYGKTISGFLTASEFGDDLGKAGWRFIAYTYGKNGGLMKAQSAKQPAIGCK